MKKKTVANRGQGAQSFKNGTAKLRNFVRGQVGAANSRAYSPKPVDHRGNLESSLRHITLVAGRLLPLSRHSEFLDWLSTQGQLLVSPASNANSCNYRSLSNRYETEATDYERQINWITSRLQYEVAAIREYETGLQELEVNIFLGDVNGVRQLISQLERKFGPTVRLMEIKLAAEQFYHGLEAQKKLAAKMRGGRNAGLIGFLIHFTSLRNEPTVPAIRYQQIVQERVLSMAQNPFRDYARYRLLHKTPDSEEQASSILQIEESHSVFDLFDTVRSLCVESPQSANSSAIGRLRDVLERRFPEYESIGIANTSSVGAAVKVGTASSYRFALRQISSSRQLHFDDVRLLSVYTAVLRPKPKSRRGRSVLTSILSHLANELNLYAPGESKHSELGKITGNFARLPLFRELFRLARTGRLNWLDPWAGDNDAFHGAKQTVGLGSYFIQNASEKIQLLRIAAWLRRLRKDRRAETLRKFADFALTRHGASQPHFIKSNLQLALCKSLIDLEDFSPVWNLISTLIVETEISVNNIPAIAALRPGKWKMISRDSQLARLAICADVQGGIDGGEAFETIKRYALEDLLRQVGVSKPSELTELTTGLSRKEYVYFLRYICVPRSMELLPGLSGSKAINSERRAICSVLLQFDRDNASEYNQEIVNIIRRERVQQGLKLVDGSRIYVDSDVLSRKLSSELAIDFERYKTLVAAGVGVAESFGEVLRNVAKPVADQELLAIPENEADDLLLELIGRVRERFLFDEMNGFDSYLGRRIRHNSMTGTMRAPLSQEHLITQYDKAAARYAPNEFWMRRLTSLNPEQQKILDRSLNSFAADFDAVGNDIKTRLFHVRGTHHTEGIFAVHVSSNAYHLLRAHAQTSGKLEEFVKACFQVFWASLGESLTKARHIIRRDARSRIETAFTSLKENLSELDSDALIDLTACIERSRQAVQKQLGLIVEWFYKREINEQKSTWDLDEIVDICIEVCMVTHRARSPAIERRVTGDILLGAESLFVLSDILWVAIDNACMHSGLVSHVPIRIYVSYDDVDNRITIDVENDIDAAVSSATWLQNIASIQEDIDKRRAADSLRVEGRSGLKKVAAMAFSVDGGGCTFGPRNDASKFGLSVSIPTLDWSIQSESDASEDELENLVEEV